MQCCNLLQLTNPINNVKLHTDYNSTTQTVTTNLNRMTADKKIDAFLSQYDEQVFINALKLREVIISTLPDIIEQLDLPAKMIAYCYGQKYSDLICVIIPSKKGLKLGFNRGSELPDPDKLLEGKGKISRYVLIQSDEQIHSSAIKKLLSTALTVYRQRMTTEK